jgi:OmpA-OmpF porin, OOP family
MRIKVLFISFLVNHLLLSQNLIENSSFEILSSCSSGPSAIYNFDAPPWESPTDNTADVFDSCAVFTAWSIPNNFAGHQLPNSGKAYAGACFYPSPEYLSIELKSPMIADEVYCISFYVNLGGKVGRATRNTGMHISSTPIYYPFIGLLDFLTPQIVNESFIADTTNWTLISGEYTAQGNENYVVIGNFSTVYHDTLIVNPGSTNPIAYYYIDDVDIHCCDCPLSVGASELEENDFFELFPNPVSELISLNSAEEFDTYEIYDLNGRLVDSGELINQTIVVDQLHKGVYTLHVISTTERIIKKFNKL